MKKLIDGELSTVEEVIEKYKRMIYGLARRYCGTDYHYMYDLKQVGYLGLAEAYKTFDDDTEVKFISLAYKYAQGYMKNLNREKGIIHVPAYVKEIAWRIEKQELWELLDSEIAARLDVQESYIANCRIFFNLKSVGSTDAERGEDSELNLYSSIGYEQDLSNPNVTYYLQNLNERELFIVDCLLQEQSYSEIGDKLELSKMRVGQIVKRIREKVTLRIENEKFYERDERVGRMS